MGCPSIEREQKSKKLHHLIFLYVFKFTSQEDIADLMKKRKFINELSPKLEKASYMSEPTI